MVYIKEALKYYQKNGEFLNLKLRFCDLNGRTNVITIHKALFADRLDKAIFTLNIRKCIAPYIDNRLKVVFVPDSDESDIIKYFTSQKKKNYYLLDYDNQGYIEKLLSKNIIIEIIDSDGLDIDTSIPKDEKVRNKLQLHLDNNSTKDEIFSISNYIVYQKKLL